MAKTKPPKSKTSNFFLCCFRSTDSPTVKESNRIPKKKRTSWFSWRWIRIKTKSTSKTVPLETSFTNVKAFSKSRSTLLHKSKTPPTNSPSLAPPSMALPATPYHSPTQTRHGPNNNAIIEETREQGRATPTRPKRQERRVSLATQNQTTRKNRQNARGWYDPIVGMSVLVVTLVIMIFWGRFCAILCTSAWLYFIPRFRKSGVVNVNDEEEAKLELKNDVDLDSEEYKKRVIMEGLLGRNNRGNI
ncbi:uncharacterized protein At5g23160 [Vicia villosa]|uniref:uncharacterized protein At5g23160 n=1 Tax=Vicia villosa TaxID=3911 RepID=UPI00273A9CAF|nr:uncharacterized protein At5g23160 [Vicia villosa]